MKTNILIIAVLLVGCGGEPFPESNYQSWYVPGHGTINVHKGQPKNPAVMDYGPFTQDMIVLSDLGSSVDYIRRDGVTLWRHYGFGRIHGLRQYDASTVTYVLGPDVHFIDIKTGALKMSKRFPVSPLSDYLPIQGGSLVSTDTGVYIVNDDNRIAWRNPFPVNYPRSIEMVGNVVVVADTFNHRVYGVDVTTNQMVFDYDEYFPNQVKQTSNGLMIVGEHSNRVYYLDVATGVRSLIYACQATPFNDVYSTSDEILFLERNTTDLLVNPEAATTSKSVCVNDLYSPNGADPGTFDQVVIASTDDGAVFEVDAAGNKVAQISGFNNPANVVILQ